MFCLKESIFTFFFLRDRYFMALDYDVWVSVLFEKVILKV